MLPLVRQWVQVQRAPHGPSTRTRTLVDDDHLHGRDETSAFGQTMTTSDENPFGPSWWRLDEPPPRRPLPQLLRDEAMTDEEDAAWPHVWELVRGRFALDEQESVSTREWCLVPPGETGSWLWVKSTFTTAYSVGAVDLVGEGPLTRADLNVLEDCGFIELDDPSLWACAVELDHRDPVPGWSLAVRAAMMATFRVYRRRFEAVGKDWGNGGWSAYSL